MCIQCSLLYKKAFLKKNFLSTLLLQKREKRVVSRSKKCFGHISIYLVFFSLYIWYSRKSGQKLSQFFLLLLCKTHTRAPSIQSSLHHYTPIFEQKYNLEQLDGVFFKFSEYELVSSEEACAFWRVRVKHWAAKWGRLALFHHVFIFRPPFFCRISTLDEFGFLHVLVVRCCAGIYLLVY